MTKREWEVNAWSDAIFVAESTGDLSPLLEILRGIAPDLVDAFVRWGVKPTPLLSDSDLSLLTAADWYYEVCPPGHLAKIARKYGERTEDLRLGVYDWIAQQYYAGKQEKIDGEYVLNPEQKRFAARLGYFIGGQKDKVDKRLKRVGLSRPGRRPRKEKAPGTE